MGGRNVGGQPIVARAGMENTCVHEADVALTDAGCMSNHVTSSSVAPIYRRLPVEHFIVNNSDRLEML